MEKLNRNMMCPKCGLVPSFNSKWKLEFKSSCPNYGMNKCEWDNESHPEHLHQECPDCGYTIVVPCLDSDAVAANTWSTASVPVQEQTRGSMGMMKPEVFAQTNNRATVTPLTTGPLSNVRYVGAPIHQSTTPVKCQSCPADVKVTAEV